MTKVHDNAADLYADQDNYYVCTAPMGRYSNIVGQFATREAARALQEELSQMGTPSQMYLRKTVFEPIAWRDKARS